MRSSGARPEEAAREDGVAAVARALHTASKRSEPDSKKRRTPSTTRVCGVVMVNSNDRLAEQAAWLEACLRGTRIAGRSWRSTIRSTRPDVNETTKTRAWRCRRSSKARRRPGAGRPRPHLRAKPQTRGREDRARSGDGRGLHVNSVAGPKSYVYSPTYRPLSWPGWPRRSSSSRSSRLTDAD